MRQPDQPTARITVVTETPSPQQVPSHGEWLRTHRQARGWNVSKMRTQLRQAATQNGDTLAGNEVLGIMMRQWEANFIPVPLRYRIHYCRLLSIDLAEFGTAPVPTREC